MGRGKRTILDVLMVQPWWYSPVASLIAYVALGSLFPSLFPQGHPAFSAIHRVMPGIATFFAFLLLVPMPFAFINGQKKKRLVDANDDLDSIRALSWREFEQLVAEAYRRKGYKVRENTTPGPDGGVDISMKKDGQLHLVQCKQWRSKKVGVQVAREMYGVMVASNARSMSIVCSGTFSQEAKSFAEGKRIHLVDGFQLNELISTVQKSLVMVSQKTGSSMNKQSKQSCPQCSSQLVIRTARRGQNSGAQFLGCSGFPRCRYTQDI